MSKRPDRDGTLDPKISLPKKFKSELRRAVSAGEFSGTSLGTSAEFLAGVSSQPVVDCVGDVFSSVHTTTLDLFSDLSVASFDHLPSFSGNQIEPVIQSASVQSPSSSVTVYDSASVDFCDLFVTPMELRPPPVSVLETKMSSETFVDIDVIGVEDNLNPVNAHLLEDNCAAAIKQSDSMEIAPEPQDSLVVASSSYEAIFDIVLGSCFASIEPDFIGQADLNSDLGTSEPYQSEDFIEHESTNTESPKPRGSELLYENAPISVEESLLATLTLALTENLNGKTLDRILKVISLHLPKPNLFSSSTFTFFNNLETHDSPIEMFYYCSVCYSHRVSSTDKCTECKGVNKTVDYFISFPISPQLSKLFSRSDFVRNLNHKQNRVKINNDNIEDIFDTEVYKKFEGNPAHQGKQKISLGWNSDGMAPYNSSTYSLSPFYLVVNELPPEERFKKENVIIAGMWGSKHKPNPNVFLRPLFDEIKKLNVEGINVQVGEKILNFIVEIIWGTCDSPAKATFLNLKSHTGFCSCPKCLILGVSVDNVTVFPHEDILLLRKDENYLGTMNYVINNRNKKNPERDLNFEGFKGATLTHFIVTDMVKSTAIDSMHCVYLGCTRQILGLVFGVTYRDKPFSLYDKLDAVNDKLSSIRLPHFVDRDLVRVDKLSCMKASVLKNMLLYILLPLMSEFMKEEHFNNLKLLVTGVALLNSNSVSREDLLIADAVLSQFVSEFEKLYTLRNMSYNIHLLRHLAKCVSETGPLALTSCFSFENLNGQLLSLAHGTRHAGLQIARTLSHLTELPEKICKLPPGPTKDYCEQLTNKSKRLKINERIGPKMFTVGKYSKDKSGNQNVLVFSRLWKNGMLYVAQSYTAGSKQSSYVKYVEDDSFHFGRITEFRRTELCNCVSVCQCLGDYSAVIQTLQCKQAFSIEYAEGYSVKVPHIYEYVVQDGLKSISVNDLANVCINVHNQYLCDPLNKFELM